MSADDRFQQAIQAINNGNATALAYRLTAIGQNGSLKFQLALIALKSQRHEALRLVIGSYPEIIDGIDDEPWDIEGREKKGLLCYCQTKTDVDVCLDLGASPDVQVGIKIDRAKGIFESLSSLHYLIMKQRYAAAVALLKRTNGLPYQPDGWGLFQFIDPGMHDAWPLVQILCERGCKDKIMPARAYYEGRWARGNLLQRIFEYGKFPRLPLLVKIFDCLWKTQKYLPEESGDSLARDNTGDSVIDDLVLSSHDAFLKPLLRNSTRGIGKKASMAIEKTCKNNKFLIRSFLGYDINPGDPGPQSAEDIETAFNHAIFNTWNVDILASLERLPKFHTNPNIWNVQYAIMKSNLPQVTAEVFECPRIEMWNFFISYLMYDFSSIDLQSIIMKNPFIESTRFEQMLMINSTLPNEKKLRPIDTAILSLFAFFGRYDLIMLLWNFNLVAVPFFKQHDGSSFFKLKSRIPDVEVRLDADIIRMSEVRSGGKTITSKKGEDYRGEFSDILNYIWVLSKESSN